MAGDGSEVVFLPDSFAGTGPNERDPTLNSVWVHHVMSASEHRLVRFTDADRAPLHLALSPKGRLVAITHGNDQDLFRFDIYTARVDGHRVRRLTTNGRSLYPSFSPDGKRIAYTIRNPLRPCTGSIRVMNADGANDHLIATGSCSRVLLRPVWVDATTLVAWSWHGSHVNGLVRVDVASHAVSTLVSGSVLDYSVSRPLGQIAIRLKGGSIELYGIANGTVTPVPGGTALKGSRIFLDGALELAY